LKGYYRGWVPPFLGSLIFRSLQFSVFELFFTKWEHNEKMKTIVPYTGGMQLRVPVSAFFAGSVRAIVECPFEFAKVKRQTGQTWKLADGYKGFFMLYPRAVGVLMIFFLQFDSIRRKTNLLDYKAG
jgi:solute carrier family 25 carnitine/acylcarnitine transporter 20/29